eukprot:CAMPEP_0116134486 /NCGR_PEP_ID=MMETSP0329-20121206/10670_1 /TAXON_ID=697910 /ORGANISM="Pseudo-nitzschia arenysensis, Strain B593" /LENGTH=592 /DNA_ID=CAMNT_0003629197 /DNA_START=60 /DNA_END=1838 /DNA_ORIENTATION=-
MTKIDETIQLLSKVPLSNGLPFYNYGTAGFRFKAEFMEGLMVRVGILSTILLLLDQDDIDLSGLLSTGVMITASHNDESYNGVKLANPDGSMLTPSQEDFLTKWVNEKDTAVFGEFLEETITKIVDKTQKKANASNSVTYVLNVGRDTRSHSKALSDLLLDGARSLIACVQAIFPPIVVDIRDHGVLTTPMLHHIVLHSNPSHLPDYIEPKNFRQGYIETYAGAYVDLLKGLTNKSDNSKLSLRIDGACGVGYKAAQQLFAEISSLAAKAEVTPTELSVLNGETDGPLNDSCGSEHVQKQLSPPTWYKNETDSYEFPYCCSLDGDADRIVFFGQANKTDLSDLLDGDKIAILIAHVLKEKFEMAIQEAKVELPDIKIGIVQTAYANGASTDYVKETLQIPVLIAKTGVKHLHHAAVEHFDVGIYFEANGHGTVVFSKTYEKFASICEKDCQNPFFVQLHKLINPAVGDALSDMLLVDYLLQSLGGWTLLDWNTKLYEDLPSRMLKVKVQDRTMIRCNSNESVCLEPSSVQPLLQAAMEATTRGRCFVRPSGTEDVVRVYAEASTRKEADSLAQRAAQIVFDCCAGVGSRPEC